MSLKTADEIAEIAAAKVLTDNDIPGGTGSAIENLGWAMGGELYYEDGLKQLVANAIEIDRAERDENWLSEQFTYGDVVVSHFTDESGVWAHLELTRQNEDNSAWFTVASLLLSDVEAQTLAALLIDPNGES